MGLELQPSFLPWNQKPSKPQRCQRSCSKLDTQKAWLLEIQRENLKALETLAEMGLSGLSLPCAERYQPARTITTLNTWPGCPAFLLKVPMQPQNISSEKRLLKQASWEVYHVFWGGGRKRWFILIVPFWKCSQVCISLASGQLWFKNIFLNQSFSKSCILTSSSPCVGVF